MEFSTNQERNLTSNFCEILNQDDKADFVMEMMKEVKY